MAFRRRGFRRGWGGPFWGPAPLLYTGAAVGAGYAIGRRGGDYYGEDPYPQPGVAPQQRPSQLVVRVHAGSGLRDRCWTTSCRVVQHRSRSPDPACTRTTSCDGRCCGATPGWG